MRHPVWIRVVSTGFGTGLIRLRPKIWTSLVAVLVWDIIAVLPSVPFGGSLGESFRFFQIERMILLALMIGVGWRSTALVERDATGFDRGTIVVGEWAGSWIAAFGLRFYMEEFWLHLLNSRRSHHWPVGGPMLTLIVPMLLPVLLFVCINGIISFITSRILSTSSMRLAYVGSLTAGLASCLVGPWVFGLIN